MKKSILVILIMVLSFGLFGCEDGYGEDINVKFDTQDGTVINDIVADFGSLIIEPDLPVREGYTFVNWYSDSNYKNEYDFTTKLGGDITLFAKWEINIYKISVYDADEQLIGQYDIEFNTDLKNLDYPEIDIPIGYRLICDQLLPETMPSQDLEFTCDYIFYQSTITFITGNDTEIESITQGENTLLDLETDLTKEEYMFDGWYLDENFEEEFKTDTMPMDDITLYAKWDWLWDTTIKVLDSLPDEEINITFWHIYGQGKSALLDALIVEFETLYPNINVESISQGSYTDLKSKTISAINSGTTPDLIVGYPDHFAEYLNGNAIIPLDSFVESETWGVDLTDFINSYVTENQQYVDGMMYSMPYSKSTEMLIYNKTVFDYHGITLPTDRPVTWEELEVYAETIVGDGYMQCDYLINYDSNENLFINSIFQWDGKYTNIAGEILIENPNTLTMLNYLDGLFESNILALPLAWDESYGSANFLKGDVCMTVGSTAGIAYNVPLPGNEGKFGEFELGILPIPQHEGGVSSVTQEGPNIAIMSDTSDEERLAAWLLISYLTSAEATAQWAIDTGYLPVRISAYDSDLYQDFLNDPDPDYKYESMTANAAYSQVDAFKYDSAFSKLVTSSDVSDEAGLALESIFTKTRTVAEAVQNMIDQLVWGEDLFSEIPDPPIRSLIAEATNALLLTDLNEVTSNLTLPSSGLHSSVITWSSSNPAIISNTGAVTRPAVGEDNTVVTLTATITIGDEIDTKVFYVRVMAAIPIFDKTIADFNSSDVSVSDKVVITGVVFGIVEGAGFHISDGTGFVYVYAGTSEGVALGDTVKVTGQKTIYYGLPEVNNVSSTKVLSSGDTQPAYEVTSIIDLFDEDPFDTIYWSKPITITGLVSVDGDGNVVLTETSAEGMAYNIVVYYKSFPAQINGLIALEGKIATVDVIVYGYHDGLGAWRVVVAEDAVITSTNVSNN